ncbi:unnamed protein product, partial [Ectocarpus sp. 8 AP-2014]
AASGPQVGSGGAGAYEMAGVHSPTYFACPEGSLYFLSFSSHVFYWVNMPSRLRLVVVGGVHRRDQFLSESLCTKRPRSNSGADFLARFLKLWAAAKSGGR